MSRFVAPLLSEAEAISIGVLALAFLEEAKQHGKYRRGAHKRRPDAREARDFYDLERALKAIETAIGREFV